MVVHFMLVCEHPRIRAAANPTRVDTPGADAIPSAFYLIRSSLTHSINKTVFCQIGRSCESAFGASHVIPPFADQMIKGARKSVPSSPRSPVRLSLSPEISDRRKNYPTSWSRVCSD